MSESQEEADSDLVAYAVDGSLRIDVELKTLNGKIYDFSGAKGDEIIAAMNEPAQHAKIKWAERKLRLATLRSLDNAARNVRVRMLNEAATTAPQPAPPKGAMGLVAFFAPTKVREQLLGDLEEAYFDNVERIGPRAAAWSYRYQVAAAALAFAGPRLLAWSGIATLLKRFGAG